MVTAFDAAPPPSAAPAGPLISSGAMSTAMRLPVRDERELRFKTARVLDRGLVRIVDAVPPRHAGRRLYAIDGRLSVPRLR